MSADLIAVDAERAVLGRLLATQRLNDDARALSPIDFGETRHAAVFGALVAVHVSGRSLDALTVAEQLRVDGKLDLVGGLPYLLHLEQSAPLLESATREHVAVVRDRAMRRALVAKARELAAAAKDLRRTPALLAHGAGQDFARLATEGASEADEMGSADVLALAERWQDFAAGKSTPYLPTGFDILDTVFRGFLQNLNLIGGAASMGKTAFVAEMVWHWLEDGKPGGIFGLEDGTGWLLERHVSRYLGIDLGDVGACRLHPEQEEQLSHFLGKAHQMLGERLRVHRTSGLGAPELLQKAERWIAKGAKWLVIDHGGRIDHGGGGRERFDLSIKRTCEGLDNLAHNAKVPIIVNWHFSREGSRREGPPTKEDFRESGYLEAFSGTMLGLWEQLGTKQGMLLCSVVKNRKGKRDVHAALARDARHGLVHRRGGYVFNPRDEAERAQNEAAPSKRAKLFGGAS